MGSSNPTMRSRLVRGVAIATLLAASPAAAQSETERADRRSLLARASEARAAGRLDEALTLARQAEAIGATGGTALFVAQVSARLERWTDAHASAARCLRVVETDTQTSATNRAAIRAACERTRDEARGHLGPLVVRVPPNAPPTLEVRVNGDLLPPGLFGAERLVAVGRATVRATLPSAPPWELAVTVDVATTTTVEVVTPEVPAPPAPAPPPPVVPPPAVVVVPPPRPAASSAQRTIGWVGVGTGVAAIVGAAIAGAVFQGTASDYAEENCETRTPNDACQNMYDRFGTLNTLQWVGYVGGGALVVTGAVLLLTAPRGRASATPAVSVSINPGLVGASLLGRF